MAGKSMKDMEDKTVDNKNSNAIEVTSAESILSRQNGSPGENQDGGLGVTEPAAENELEENACLDTLKSSSENRHERFLDLIRNKLISDFSSGIFSDLETEINKIYPSLINTERLSVIEEILVQIYLLSDPEKLLLYLKLPKSQNSTADPLTLPLNPLGNRQEIQQAIVWIKTHLEEDKEKSILKQDVYDQYVKYCQNGSMKALSTADFGKVMKQVYPDIRRRRLGTRGNSRYCYSGMRNTVKLPTPHLPDSVHKSNEENSSTKNDCGSTIVVSKEIEQGKTGNRKKKLKKPSKSAKISSATVVKDSARKDSTLSHIENVTMENKVTTDPATDKNFTNDMNASSKNQDNLSQPLIQLPTMNVDDNNYALGKDLSISPDNVTEVTKNDCTKDKINLELLDKVELKNEELNVKGVDETDKSNEVKSNQNIESAESQPNKFLLTRLPLGIVKRIIQIVNLKRLNNQRAPRVQSGRSSPRSQRLRARRPRLRSQRCRRRGYIPIRPKPVNGETYWLHIHLALRNKKNEVPDLPEVEEEIVKYFRHLEDIELLGAVGGTIVDELLKLEKISGNIFQGLKNIRRARSQSCLGNYPRIGTTVGNAVQGGLPQRSQSSVEYSAEPTVTFQKQGNVKYVSDRHLLITSTENTLNLNTVELNTQNTAVIDGRRENLSVSPSTNYFHFIPISPGPRTPMLTPETSPFLIPQNAQLIPNNFSPPNSHFLYPNPNFLPSNNSVLPPNNNLVSPGNIFLPENNSDLNNFDINTGIVNGGFNVQNNVIPGGTFPKPVPDTRLKSYSADFYCLNTPENSYEISSLDQFLPNEANFNQAAMETNSDLPNLSEEIDQLLINETNFEDLQASVSRSQSAPINSMTDGEFWFPYNNICSDTVNNFDEYSKDQMNQLDLNEYSFEPISDCQTMEPVTENEPFPILSLDDLAVDSDDMTDQVFSDNFVSDPSNINIDNNSLDTLPGKIDENNVFESSFSPANVNPYLGAAEGPMNQTNSVSEPEVGDMDFFDNLFDLSTENPKDSGNGTLKLVMMNEFRSYHESSTSDTFSYGNGVDNPFSEDLDLN